MTDTVSVPVDLLKALREDYPSYARGIGTIADLVALVPTPPKVGDVLTDFEQVADLPDTAVIVDRDGDVYVVGGGEAMQVTDRLSLSHEVSARAVIGMYDFSDFTPFTLHYLPDNA